MFSEPHLRAMFQLLVGIIAGVRYFCWFSQSELSLSDPERRSVVVNMAINEMGCALLVALLCFG